MKHAPKTNIAKLQGDQLEDLAELFAEEKLDSATVDYWQDRRAGFLKPYSLIQAGSPHYLAVREGSRFAACSGAIPSSVNFSPFRSLPLMDTDLMISTKYRFTGVGRSLIEERVSDFAYGLSENSVLWGVEQSHGNLSLCHRFAKKHGGHFLFPWNSTLTQIFLTQEPKSTKSDDSDKQSVNKVEVKLLRSLSSNEIENYLRDYKSDSDGKLFSSQLSSDRIRQIVILDPDAQVIQNKSSGAILMSANSLRTFRFTGKPSLLLERLRRKRKMVTLADEALHLGYACFTWNLSHSVDSVRSVFQRCVDEAEARAFDCVAFRDELPDSLSNLSPDTLSFTRRVFLAFGPRNPEFAKLEEFAKRAATPGSPYTVKIDVSSL